MADWLQDELIKIKIVPINGNLRHHFDRESLRLSLLYLSVLNVRIHGR
jgi:hypothetical protein